MITPRHGAKIWQLMREITAQEFAFQVVGEASDGAEALALAQALQPDIVLLDLAMPRVQWPGGPAAAQGAWPATRGIVVTVHEEDAYRQAAAACVRALAGAAAIHRILDTRAGSRA